MRQPEPCLCGDPCCPRCFPVYEEPDVEPTEEDRRVSIQEMHDDERLCGDT